MVTINKVGKAFSRSLESSTPGEAARYFAELEWQVALEVGAGNITSEEGDTRFEQIQVEIGSYLDRHSHSDFHSFIFEYHKTECRRMFKWWTLDSLKYIDHVLVVCGAVDIFKQIIDDGWELSPPMKAGLSRVYRNIAEIRRIDIEAKNTILADAPWEQFGMTRPDEPEPIADNETIPLAT